MKYRLTAVPNDCGNYISKLMQCGEKDAVGKIQQNQISF
jgi:hypothetical protein